jgi:hypothetical protein
MADGSIAVAYLSMLLPGTQCMKGDVKFHVRYGLYGGKPDKTLFPRVGRPIGLPSSLGWDEYQHKPWTDKKPWINAKPLAAGKFDATFRWDCPKYSFTSTSIGIKGGPQRPGRGPQFPNAWVFDPELGWVLIPLKNK